MKQQGECVMVERRIVRLDAIEALQQALDYTYRRVRQAARQTWTRHFGDKPDPSDSCVAVRCSGFLPDRQTQAKPRPRFGC